MFIWEQDVKRQQQSGQKKTGKEPSWILILVLTLFLMLLGHLQISTEVIFTATVICVAGVFVVVPMIAILETRIIQLQAWMWSERDPQIMLQGIKKLRIYYLCNTRLVEKNKGIAYILNGDYEKAAKIWKQNQAIIKNKDIVFESSWYLLWIAMLQFHRKEATEYIEQWKGFPAVWKVNNPIKTPMVEIFRRIIEEKYSEALELLQYKRQEWRPDQIVVEEDYLDVLEAYLLLKCGCREAGEAKVQWLGTRKLFPCAEQLKTAICERFVVQETAEF